MSDHTHDVPPTPPIHCVPPNLPHRNPDGPFSSPKASTLSSENFATSSHHPAHQSHHSRAFSGGGGGCGDGAGRSLHHPSFDLADFDPPPKKTPFANAVTSFNNPHHTQYTMGAKSSAANRLMPRSTPATPALISAASQLSPMAYHHSNAVGSPSSATCYSSSANGVESTAILNKAYGDFLTITPRRKSKGCPQQQRYATDHAGAAAPLAATTPTSIYELRSAYNDSETLRLGDAGPTRLITYPTARCADTMDGAGAGTVLPAATSSGSHGLKIIAYANVSPPNAFSDAGSGGSSSRSAHSDSAAAATVASVKGGRGKAYTDYTIAV